MREQERKKERYVEREKERKVKMNIIVYCNQLIVVFYVYSVRSELDGLEERREFE